jgi:O-antigen/teichoic acid export membrane protein
MSLFAEEGISLLLAPSYHEAWRVAPLAVSAIVFNSVKEFWLRPLTYEKSTTKYVPIATYTFAILSVSFTALLVPAFGLMGAAWAILGARFISSFVMVVFSVRAVNVGYPVREIYGIAIAAFGLSMIAYLPIQGLLIIKLAVAAVVVSIVTVVMRDDISELLRQIRRRPAALPS